MNGKTFQYKVIIPRGYVIQEAGKGTLAREEKKVHRNDPCPCGSGVKAKHCHPEAARL